MWSALMVIYLETIEFSGGTVPSAAWAAVAGTEWSTCKVAWVIV